MFPGCWLMLWFRRSKEVTSFSSIMQFTYREWKAISWQLETCPWIKEQRLLCSTSQTSPPYLHLVVRLLSLATFRSCVQWLHWLTRLCNHKSKSLSFRRHQIYIQHKLQGQGCSLLKNLLVSSRMIRCLADSCQCLSLTNRKKPLKNQLSLNLLRQLKLFRKLKKILTCKAMTQMHDWRNSSVLCDFYNK